MKSESQLYEVFAIDESRKVIVTYGCFGEMHLCDGYYSARRAKNTVVSRGLHGKDSVVIVKAGIFANGDTVPLKECFE